MMLVVIQRRVVRAEHESPVAEPMIGIRFLGIDRHHRTDNSDLVGVRHVLQGTAHFAFAPFVRQARSVGTETGSEHLRHDGDVCASGYGPQAFV